MFKKMMILGAIVAAFAAMAVPAMAETNGTWKDKGTAITGTKTLLLTGSASFSGGTACSEVHAHIDLEEGSTGLVTSFEVTNPTSPSCVVTNTLKALGCTNLVSATATNTKGEPLTTESGNWWVIHNTITSTDHYISITNVSIDNVYEGGGLCPKNVSLTGTAKATPDNTNEISTLTLGGTLTSSLGTSVTVGGTLSPSTPSDVKTYGL